MNANPFRCEADMQQPEAQPSRKAKRFSEMTLGEKIVHATKVVVFFLSFGFAFPDILSD
jgi:hypothetical protein